MYRIHAIWIRLKSSLWFVPMLMVAGAILGAVSLIKIEGQFDLAALRKFPLIFGAGAQGARQMLAAVASSMITVAGVTFSLTLAALAQASNQYTPRVLRNFMRDRANQIVLGFFVGTFAYCLIVLRTIYEGNGETFVPVLAVFAGLLLAFVGIAVLIFFIHHIAASLQAATIAANIADETLALIETLFPQEPGEATSEAASLTPDEALAAHLWHPILASKSGYIQMVDIDTLLTLACEHGVIIRMERGVGQFVTSGAPLASLAAHSRTPDMAAGAAQLAACVNDCFNLSCYRTLDQDVAFGIRQLVDIALKALSPGVNDTTTAITCVDYLGTILTCLARRRMPSRYRFDDSHLRVIVKAPTFAILVAASFDQMRGSAAGNAAVLVRMLGVIGLVGQCTPGTLERRALATQVQLIVDSAERTLPTAYEKSQIQARLEQVMHVLPEAALPTAQCSIAPSTTDNPGVVKR